ncbi:hypothetical protein [Facklamia sp. 7083-14-GEN3]|uniref:hypothetical protein n=1 Tax=Facklamia sp. 7083-14-GEN3 TaxID=2973478 RepID=UPI00215CE11D|nr:hypothetical protein [Facklamia sp. 7083-14-GEN3]MCR8969050.1 hypothetical protein [Facklamia sp. 7083-14-GEN3]
MKNTQPSKNLPGCWKWFFGVVILLIILVIAPFYLFTNVTTTQDRVVTQKTESIASSENLGTTVTTTEESTQALSNELKEQTALLVLRDNYEGFAAVDFDEANKTFTITPTDEDFKDSIKLLVEGNPDILPAWQEMKDELKSAYNEIAKELDGDYTFNLVNPAADDELVLSILNNEIIFDKVDETY